MLSSGGRHGTRASLRLDALLGVVVFLLLALHLSGLFAFGWTASVLVGFVTSLDRLRERAAGAADRKGGAAR